jgi:TetR/AcrR family tetracycline transcriptional repressor
MLDSRRDGARLVAGTRPSPEVFALVEGAVETLERAGFSAVDAFRGLLAVSVYVGGFALEEQADRMRADEEPSPDLAEFHKRYPRMMAAMMEAGEPQGDNSFESGLALILDGMELRLSRGD